MAVILLSVAAIILESVHSLYEQWSAWFTILEWGFLLFFGLEYAGHLYVAEHRWSYVFSFWGLVDLLAIVPSLAALFSVAGLRELRVLRVLRVLRTLKLIKVATLRAQQANDAVAQRQSTLRLDLQIYFLALFTVMVTAATLVYHAEEAVPDTPFSSIPAALWWAMGTVATHGSPFATVTIPGRLVAAATMLAGVALFGILTNVIGRALLTSLFGADPEEEEEQRRRQAARDARRQALAARARELTAQVAQTIDRVVQAAGPLPELAPNSPQSRRRTGSHGKPLTVDDSGYLLRSQVAAEGTAGEGHRLRRLIYHAFVEHTSALYRAASRLILACIFLSLALLVLQSVEWIDAAYGAWMDGIEVAVVMVFTLEYAANIYVAERKWRYVFSLWGLIDLASILPWYAGLLNIGGLTAVRTLRVLRVLRVLKLTRKAALQARQSARSQRNTLWLDLQIYFMALGTAMMLSATVMWYAEKDAGSGFASIPEGLWFAIITLTTTGSGAPIPVTTLGRLTAAATMITGLGLFGVLSSVIGRAMLSSLFGTPETIES